MMIDYSQFKLYEREAIAFHPKNPEKLRPQQPEYCIVWEDNLDEPVKITTPSPEWWSMALAGGILPPVSVYHNLKINENGEVVNGHILHDTPPIGPMTPEQAIEYILVMTVPTHVWVQKHNRPKFYITKRNLVPTDRTFRNAWTIGDIENDEQRNKAA